jgi:hypothetical protein
VLGLVSGAPFDVAAIEASLAKRDYSAREIDIAERHPSGTFSRYLGPLSALAPSFERAALITCDRPILERMAAEPGRGRLVGESFLALARVLFAAAANPNGEIWSSWDDAHESWRQSGLIFNRYWFEQQHGRSQRADLLLSEGLAQNPAAAMAR